MVQYLEYVPILCCEGRKLIIEFAMYLLMGFLRLGAPFSLFPRSEFSYLNECTLLATASGGLRDVSSTFPIRPLFVCLIPCTQKGQRQFMQIRFNFSPDVDSKSFRFNSIPSD